MILSTETWLKVTSEAEAIANTEDIIVDYEAHNVEQAIKSVIQYN